MRGTVHLFVSLHKRKWLILLNHRHPLNSKDQMTHKPNLLVQHLIHWCLVQRRPLEVQVPSLRVAIQCDLTTDELAKNRFNELYGLDEKRLEAKQRIELYQARMAPSYNRAEKHNIASTLNIRATYERCDIRGRGY